MIKIISLVLIFLLIGGIAFAATITSPGIGDIMGQGQFPSDPGRTFRLVRYVPTGGNDNIPSLTADSAVIWSRVSDDGVTITTTTQTTDSGFAGIVPNAISTPDFGALGATVSADIGRRNWGFLQTYGLSQGTMNTVGSVAAGDAIGCAGEAGRIGRFATGTTASASDNSATLGNMGFALDAIAASGTNGAIFLRCE